MPTVHVLQMHAIAARRLRSPANSANKQPSARTRQSWSDIGRERPSATIPIVIAHGFVQSGFCEVAPTVLQARPRRTTSQNPQD